MTTGDAAGTERVGAGIAALARPGDVILLRGELGAGKTTLVRGAARALGVAEHVTSPSFAVAQRYDGRVPVAHLDAYRLGQVDAEELGLALEVAEGAVTFVEWPDALAEAFADAVCQVVIEHLGGDARRVCLTWADPAAERAMGAALADARD